MPAEHIQSIFFHATQLLGRPRIVKKRREKNADQTEAHDLSLDDPIACSLSQWCSWIFGLNQQSAKLNAKFIDHFLLAVDLIVDQSQLSQNFAQLFPRDYPPSPALQLFGITSKIRAAGPPKKRPTFDLYAKSSVDLYNYVENLTWSLLSTWHNRRKSSEETTGVRYLLNLLGGASRINPEAGFIRIPKTPLRVCRFCKCSLTLENSEAEPEASKANPQINTDSASDGVGSGEDSISIPDSSPIDWTKYSESPLIALSGAATTPDPSDPKPGSPYEAFEDIGGESSEIAVSVEVSEDIRWWKHTRTFCSAGCQYMHILSSSGQMLRHRLEVRDGTACANCSLCMKDLFEAYRLACKQSGIDGNLNASSKTHLDECVSLWYDCSPWGDETGVTEAIGKRIYTRLEKSWYMEACRRRNYGLRLGDLWQADHILPVILGGGTSFTLFNLRTLCASCHRIVTKHLAHYSFKNQQDAAVTELSSPYMKVAGKGRKGMKRWYGRV